MKRQIAVILTVLSLCVLLQTLSTSSASEVKQTAARSSDIFKSLVPGWGLSGWFGPAAAPQPTIGPPEEESFQDQDDPDLRPGSRMNKEQFIQRRNEYFAMLRGYDPEGPFDSLARGRAIREMEGQERQWLEAARKGIAPAINPLTWTPIGPAPIPQGQTQGRIDPVSGRVIAMAVHPTNPSIVYAGAAAGGVWRSTNGGTNWTPIFDSADSLAIGALAIAPSQPSTLYVGTGEIGNFFGVGVYRIDNADSAAPTLVGPINPVIDQGSGFNRGAFHQVSISEILVHPTDPATIFVSTASGFGGITTHNSSSATGLRALRGIFRSTNATAATAALVNFTKLTVNTNGGVAKGDTEVTDMVLEPGAPNNLICWVRSSAAAPNAGGIYKSADALTTATFTQKLTAAEDNTRGELAINKVGAAVTVYAATGEAPAAAAACAADENGKLRRSNDGGETWPDDIVGAAGFCGGQCFYDIGIEIDPTNANNVQIGGSLRGTCAAITKRSTNGSTFTRNDTGLHADVHTFAIAPSNPQIIYTGNDGGIWKSLDGGATWANLNNADLNVTQFVSIALHPTDREFMTGGTQDNGTELRRASGTWTQIAFGDGGYTLIDRNATNTTNVTIYHTYYNLTDPGGQIEFDRVDLTADAEAKNWENYGCPGTGGRMANGISCSDRVLFYAPMALGPGNPNTVYFGTDRLYRSTDKGVNMTVVGSAGALSATSAISSISISPQNDNVRVVGLRNGTVFATTTGGTLTDISPPNRHTGPPAAPVGKVYVDPTNSNTAYVTYGGFGVTAGRHIFKTTNLNAGTPTWTDSGAGLPDVPVNAITSDRLTPNNLWVGTDIGVYRSVDGGANWIPFNSGLPRVPVFDIGFQEQGQTDPLSARVLRIGTHGRGIWEIQIGGATPSPSPSPSPNTIQFSLAAYPVTEGTSRVDTTVTRVGSTAGAAKVSFATSDLAGTQACTVANARASSRCDYITRLNTVNFAAGETSKTVSILIVDDAYLEGAETFTVTLSNATGATLGTPTTATITIADNDSANGPNPIDTTSFFVRLHYLDFLNREPDTSGLNFWIGQIDSCTPKPACTEPARVNTSGAFFLSIEFQQTGFFVERFFKAAYGDADGNSTNPPAPHTLKVPIVRFAEFLLDTQKIGEGVVVLAPGWEALLESNKQAYALDFVMRTRFTTAFANTLTPMQFVDMLFANAGVMPTAAQRMEAINEFGAAGTSADAAARARALRRVADHATFIQQETNRAFVLMQYFGYLRRNPDDFQDSNHSGYEFWLGKLNEFNGNFINAEMVKAFIQSGEYRQRFGP